jgi:hypothetical protein
VLLSSLYPTQYSVGVCGVFLVVRVRELPPQPWPLTVAGLPFYITTDEWDVPWPFGTIRQHNRDRILEELDARQFINDGLFAAAIKWFDEESTVTISAIMWSAGMWQITIPDDSDLSILPARICQSLCTYLYESELPTQPEAAFRQISPTTTVRDDSRYDILRPGIMISSGQFSGYGTVPTRLELYTTAGVLVKDRENNEFVTVASHGFPLGEETVYHPDPDGSIIGDIKYRLDETDIALLKLRDGVVFENKSFQSLTQPTDMEFTQVARPHEDLHIGDPLQMDNPFTGCIESSYFGTELRRVPDDSPDPKFHWTLQLWAWYGQHAGAIPAEGSCGSPIWNEDGKLVCFFRYLTHSGPRAGYGYAVSAIELQRFGLELSTSR